MGRDGKPQCYGFRLGFQSTRPHGARHRLRHITMPSTPFQSTRPHGARRQLFGAVCRGGTVSIHAPAWGATQGSTYKLRFTYRFQSTRPHGARPYSLQALPVRSTCFNPRARMGRDGCHLCGVGCMGVSIHAPAWGATGETDNFFTWPSFNPRARMGRDFVLLCGVDRLPVSIHAPAWGATVPVVVWLRHQDVSIHAPAWGATLEATDFLWPNECFNPRARMGRDCTELRSIAHPKVSIHAPAWGATY